MPTIRRLSGLVLVAALVLALAAPASAQKTKLTYAGWLGLYGAYKDAVQYMKDEFERKNPSVDFVRNDVPFDQALNQATISFQGKNSSDVIHAVAGWLPTVVEIGAVMPLNDVFPAGFWAKIPKGLLDSVTIDGKIMPCLGCRARS
jgi:ABC-type glycerol-3-phosphate transport system substrate-binding protein